ncbi:MAG: extracellular solute-binding protein [Oscillospiraceae bacterium]|nr:extracellular solute-binding protein [Oscillospiraceae bacterium]
MKKAIALLLSVVLILSLTACFGGEDGPDRKYPVNIEDYPEYLNLESAYPVIKDEYAGTIKLRVAIATTATGGNWEDLWICQYLREKYNVEFEVFNVLDTALGDRKSLLMSSGDLPDIMISMQFTNDEIYQYGMEQGLLLECDHYINEILTPNLYKYMQQRDVASTCTLPDGHVYSLPWIFYDDPALYNATYINQEWLDALGVDMPATLDEFVDVMYKMKEANLSGLGSQNIYPFAGGMGQCSNSNAYFLLNALGYVTNNNYGIDPAMRNGEVVIPAYDLDVYQEFLKLMHQFYVDGIVPKNLFTTNDTEQIAQLQNGAVGMYHDEVHATGYKNYKAWTAAQPLTSQWSSTAVTTTPNRVRANGGFVISADTEYPELCMRIADMWYNYTTDDCRALWLGAQIDTEWDLGYAFNRWDNEKQDMVNDDKRMQNLDVWTYIYQELIGFYPQWGAVEDEPAYKKHAESIEGGYYTGMIYSSEDAEGHARLTTQQNVVPYAATTFPTIYYVDADTMIELTDLRTVIEPYVQEEVAKFILGRREINDTELAKFKSELESMGIQRLLDIYKEIYAAQQ